MLTCQYCTKISKNPNAHRNHERCCPLNPNRNYKNHKIGKKGGNQYSYADKNGLQRPKAYNAGQEGFFKGKKHTEETKQKISAALSINNKGGRCKWYEVSGQKVQGTWERDLATHFELLGIQWIKLKTNRDTFKYVLHDKLKSYTPDFYLPEYDLYLELKGHWWGNDKYKMRLVTEHNPELQSKLRIIEKEQYEFLINAGVADVVLALS